MALINVLDKQTANLIAAGEVVDRPASVVKELIENSIDAKASAITVQIKNGGTTLIRITDNGCGMDKDDLKLSILRHATSKISKANDLDSINTLGFRGEALAAISSVSNFEIHSKQKDTLFGHRIEVEGEKMVAFEEIGCPDGTTVIVKNLFFNQPARRKFLKRDSTEAAAVIQCVERIALSRPDISIKLVSDGETKLMTSGNGSVSDCVRAVFGKEFFEALTPIEYNTGAFSVSGFVSKPEYARSNRAYQTFFINGRLVKSKTMFYALEEAFKSYMKTDRFPACVMFLSLDSKTVDVNVHPSKLEVRFSDERSVYTAIYTAVKNSLEKLRNAFSKREEPVFKEEPVSNIETVRTLDFKEAEAIKENTSYELPVAAFTVIKEKPKTNDDFEFNGKIEVKRINDLFFFEEEKRASVEQLKLTETDIPKSEKEENENNPLVSDGVILGVAFNAFIIYESNGSLYFIDKHAAHERILYERLKKGTRENSSQLLAEPILLSLGSMQTNALIEHGDKINECGFSLERFGETEFLVRSVPFEFSGFTREAQKELLEKMADGLLYGKSASLTKEEIFDKTLYSVACKAAVKAGIADSSHDYKWIVDELKKQDNIVVCPHGRPILIKYTKNQIEKMFLRT